MLRPHEEPAARTATEELFGPILVLIPFEDEEAAYRIANGTAYALTAGVFSRSPATIARATRAIVVGTIYVNRGTTGARVGIEPFGGLHMSGTGPKAGGPDYLWAFVRRIDAPEDTEDERAAIAGGPIAAFAFPSLLAARWDAPLEARIEAVERAAVLLGSRGDPDAGALLAAAQSARRELGAAVPTPPVAGQHTELRYDLPRGLGVVRAPGSNAAWWLAAPLLAGNAVAVIDAAPVATLIAALRVGGVPAHVLLALDGGIPAMLAAAGSDMTRSEVTGPHEVAFATSDGGPALARALHERLGPTYEGQRGLKAQIGTLEGPQPGERGFVQRFAWPRVVAIRTLRHGADLAIETSGAG